MNRIRLVRKLWGLLFKLGLGIAIAFLLTLWGGQLTDNSFILPSTAQSIRPEYVSDVVYQRFPDIPQENQYKRQENGEIDPNNTLISRLVRYHEDVKKRPLIFRLDWQLTIADYLGVNEPIKAERYPGKATLTVNPMETDIKAVRSLTRRQRRELVDLIVSIYNPQTDQDTNPSTPTTKPIPQPSPETTPKTPTLSQPGDSQLLLP